MTKRLPVAAAMLIVVVHTSLAVLVDALILYIKTNRFDAGAVTWDQPMCQSAQFSCFQHHFELHRACHLLHVQTVVL